MAIIIAECPDCGGTLTCTCSLEPADKGAVYSINELPYRLALELARRQVLCLACHCRYAFTPPWEMATVSMTLKRKC